MVTITLYRIYVEKIVEYRALLKQQVDNTLSTGKLQRLIPQDRHQPVKLKINSNDLPTLSSPSKGTTPWRLASAQSQIATITKENEEPTRMLLEIIKNILEMKDYTHSMNDKLDRINERVNNKALDTELHHETVKITT
ncbi:unnamed protein product [Rotaria socialis]|uniref:Uncharacterized protein n=1 Tax=Rotaria socialis TaxID=392032 RepID=A0A817MT08_9BILA|nr:unnamed protein product [Rotaria socialis]CAF3331941.1 unnamed protein product [Rotaria socialis]CAF3431250.1 unnamed protein product [Rotaria socialis]CAF3459759.1 unnamed protein product [Rotaria socialis]